MEEYTIKVGDRVTFIDPEGKNISQETVEEIFVQSGRINVKCKQKTYDHRIWGFQIIS